MKFFVDEQAFSVLPDYCVGVLVVEGFDNSAPRPAVEKLLDESAAAFGALVGDVNLKQDPRIEPYRSAFRLLGINPNKFQCSIEALAKRLQKKPELPHINPLVDLGNAVSLRRFVPLGVHDIAKFDGDSLGVRFYESGDHFTPMGGGEVETPDERELLYVSGHTVKTRRWTWRQSEDGKIDSATTRAVIVIDGFTGRNRDNVVAARDELAKIFADEFGLQTHAGMVDREAPEFVW